MLDGRLPRQSVTRLLRAQGVGLRAGCAVRSRSTSSGRLPDVKYTGIADEILANASALEYEVNTLAQCFAETNFFGDTRNFPHAHYGYLMACMGQIDLMSKCEFGPSEPKGGQTVRMQSFMERYLDAQKADEHRVAIQLMRHTLMHTGALRFLYEEKNETGYTWRIYFGETFPSSIGHYTLTVEDPQYQDVLRAAVKGTVSTVKALNVKLTAFAADILRVAKDYTAAMGNDPTLCNRQYLWIKILTRPPFRSFRRGVRRVCRSRKLRRHERVRPGAAR